MGWARGGNGSARATVSTGTVPMGPGGATMPKASYKVARSDACPETHPWAAFMDGAQMGCHATQADAQAHCDMMAAAEGTPMPRTKRPERGRLVRYRLPVYELRVGVPGGSDGLAEGEFVATVLRYLVLDSYGTGFAPGCATSSLAEHMPKVAWGHDWLDPIGRYVDFDDTRDRLRLRGMLDLDLVGNGIPAVPSAHRARVQMASGTIDQFSIGFCREASEEWVGHEPAELITEIDLEEASPVMVASVPGTELIGVRSGRPHMLIRAPKGKRLLVPLDQVEEIMLGWHAGELDLADALQAFKAAAVDAPSDGGDGDGGQGSKPGAAGGETGAAAGEGQQATSLPPAGPTPEEQAAAEAAAAEQAAAEQALLAEVDAALNLADKYL